MSCGWKKLVPLLCLKISLFRLTASFDYVQGKLKINGLPTFPRLREDKFARLQRHDVILQNH